MHWTGYVVIGSVTAIFLWFSYYYLRWARTMDRINQDHFEYLRSSGRPREGIDYFVAENNVVVEYNETFYCELMGEEVEPKLCFGDICWGDPNCPRKGDPIRQVMEFGKIVGGPGEPFIPNELPVCGKCGEQKIEVPVFEGRLFPAVYKCVVCEEA